MSFALENLSHEGLIMASPNQHKDEPMDMVNSPELKDQKCFLQSVSNETVLSDLKDAVYKSFLDDNTTSVCWQPVGFELVNNEELIKRYQGRREELRAADRSEEELEDRYGFLIARSKKDFWAIVNSGLHSAMSVFSVFGPAKSGIYLYQHADLCLKNFALAQPVDKDVQLILFKYFEGKTKRFVTNLEPSDPKVPSVDIDCHMCSLRPIATDKPELQFLKSQIYLYELDEYEFPACRPRQCVPYAIVTFTKATLAASNQGSTPTFTINSASQQNGGNTTQLRGADRFAKYPGLKDIIAGINSKPSIKSSGTPTSRSPRGDSQEKKPEPVRSRRDSDRSDQKRPTDNPKIREVIDKVNSKKVEKSSLLPIHKNWQQPNQGYQPYRQMHPGQRGGNLNRGQHGHAGQRFNSPQSNQVNLMNRQATMMQQRQQSGAMMQQRMESSMMQQQQQQQQQQQRLGMFQQQGGNGGFKQGGGNMHNMGMMQGENQGMNAPVNNMNNFNGMNNMNSPRMQQNMQQQSNSFSLLNAFGNNQNQHAQMNNQRFYGNQGGQNMQQGGWPR